MCQRGLVRRTREFAGPNGLVLRFLLHLLAILGQNTQVNYLCHTPTLPRPAPHPHLAPPCSPPPTLPRPRSHPHLANRSWGQRCLLLGLLLLGSCACRELGRRLAAGGDRLPLLGVTPLGWGGGRGSSLQEGVAQGSRVPVMSSFFLSWMALALFRSTLRGAHSSQW